MCSISCRASCFASVYWKKRLNSSFSSKQTEAKQIAWQEIEQILPTKPTRRPLPLLLSPSFFYEGNKHFKIVFFLQNKAGRTRCNWFFWKVSNINLKVTLTRYMAELKWSTLNRIVQSESDASFGISTGASRRTKSTPSGSGSLSQVVVLAWTFCGSTSSIVNMPYSKFRDRGQCLNIHR